VYFGFLPSVLFYQCFILVFIYMLLLPGQTGEAWNASQKQCAFGNQGALDKKFLSLFFFFRRLKESEDHCSVVYTYTKTYASEAMRLYGGCVCNFYTPRSCLCTHWWRAPSVPVVVGLGGYGGPSGHGDESSLCRESNTCHRPFGFLSKGGPAKIFALNR
jgi:hypothetical protein